jgi:hypothetical protein
VKSPLNLATRPVRNEALPALLFFLGLALLVGLSLRHAFLVADLASAAATQLDEELLRLTKEQRELEQREQSLRAVRVDPAALGRWMLLKRLVDQRTFSWTGLLSRLEAALPAGVRLVGISPQAKKGRIVLKLEAVLQETEDAVPLVKVLEDRPEFEQVFLLSIAAGREEGVRCDYEMTYRPEAAAPAGARAADAEPSSAEAGP